MTEWDAAEYARRSSLQEAMALEVLALCDLGGSQRILDVGCGEGKITAQIAGRVPEAIEYIRDFVPMPPDDKWLAMQTAKN